MNDSSERVFCPNCGKSYKNDHQYKKHLLRKRCKGLFRKERKAYDSSKRGNRKIEKSSEAQEIPSVWVESVEEGN